MLAAAGAAMLVASGSAEASRIHGSISARGSGAWARYLGGGPALWARVHDPVVTPGIKAMMFESTRSTDPSLAPMAQFLIWRRELNPPRFDHWHPFLGPAVARLMNQIASVPTVTAQFLPPPMIAPPPPIVPIPVPQPQIITPPPVIPPPAIVPPPQTPEPSTWMISVMLIGSGVWWRWRHGAPVVAD